MPRTPSPLRYPGGKAKLYPLVHKIISDNGLLGETYIEPFAGGAGLALKLLLNNDVKRIVLNDFDPAIFAFWYCVLHESAAMCQFVKTVDISMTEWEKQREIYRNQDKYSQLDVAKAVLFLNRTNVSGVITGGVIGGKEQTGKNAISARFNRTELARKITEIAAQADRIDLYNLDASVFIETVLPHYYKVFINFDPPYVEKGGQLYKNSFTESDHEALRNCIARCRRKWMVTYDVCDLVATLYREYRGGKIEINYSAKDVRKAKEYIFFSHNLVVPTAVILDEKNKDNDPQTVTA